MAVTLEKFVQQLEDSGIIASDTIKDFIPPKASPKDATDLARELVRQKKLTKFQVEEVSKGKGKSLVLGNYVLMEQIGAGGMGQVFKARHKVMNRLVAVKVLPTARTQDKAAISRFHREVQAAAKLRHINIVAADDADQANGVHFLVMELVEGSDLSALVKKNGPFSIERAVNCVVQAARGLEFAHKKGVVHRDIKPANLLLDTEGTVKILDMGLARLGADADDAPQADLTSTGTVMGTVDYMAPEQALDTKSADARADIYSLGCSLYFLLTGKATYGGDTLMKKLLAHRDQPIPALRTIRPEVSEQLEAVFKKLVAKKVEDRYQSMTEVIVELERCTAGPATSVTIQQPATTTSEDGTFDFLKKPLEEPTILAKPPKRSAPGKTGNGKNKFVLIGAAVLGVMMLAGIIVSLKTKDGTLIVEVDQPDAMVQVLDAEGKVEISQKGGKGLVSISVDPGKHRLQIEKDGFTVFGQDFEMKSGGKTPIKAKLVPLDEKPAMVGAKPAPVTTAGTKPPVVAGVTKPLAFETPGFDQWVKDVQALTAEQQVEAVSKKLVELNPGFDGKVTPTIQSGVVTELRFFTDHVTDISPVRALARLFGLRCNGSDQRNQNGQLTDLSPLRGMQLTYLHCVGTQVSDLSPLKDVPLFSGLSVASTPVNDLSPLKGIPLTTLDITGTQVADLSPLKGMPLEQLWMASTLVTDLSPLKEIPLKKLTISETHVADLSPIKDMPLQLLSLDFSPKWDTELLRSIKTLETISTSSSTSQKPTAEFCNAIEAYQAKLKKPLAFEAPGFDQWAKQVAAMPADEQVKAVAQKLQELNPGFGGKVTPTTDGGVVTGFQFLTDNVTDISPVRAFEGLKSLQCSAIGRGQGGLGSLAPLKGMSLTELLFDHSHVADLSPLKGMKLTKLSCYVGSVTDLSPLKDMPLTRLLLSANPVSDLSPLKGTPLTEISFNTTLVTDLSPLQGLPLTVLSCYGTNVADLSPLRDLPLTYLVCGRARVTDFSPLKDMPLTYLQFDFSPALHAELLRSIKTLETINGKPAAEFWKVVEGKKSP
jgi:serine/threonine protein kinase/Leucine-rich repeat (LRR) protein